MSKSKSKFKPRLLCLHGAGSNGEIAAFQTAGLDLQNRFVCVYLRAPHTTRPAPGLEHFSEGPFHAWADASRSASDQEDQWDESLGCIAEYCKGENPFDGVYGFSQGASIITDFSHTGVWKTRFGMKACPWKFAILACGAGGYRINTPRAGSTAIDIPSFHIFGKKDNLLNGSRAVAEYWAPSRRVTHTHDRGHEIDMQMHVREKEMMKKLNTFLDEQCVTETGLAAGIM
jgi:hypothetical protein